MTKHQNPVVVLRGLVVLAVAASLAACAPKEDPAHHGFSSSDEAVTALVAAMEAGNLPELRLLFGPDSEALIDSGDAVADAGDRKEFVAAYRAHHALVKEADGRTVLEIGAQKWPLPVPLVQRDGRWFFDGVEGVDEILYRRLGANELGAISVCRGFVAAQNEYAATGHDGNPAGFYAAHLISDPGTHNGLYWPTGEDEQESPAGPFVAAAAGEGYRRGAAGQRVPYHGYFYRMLYAQGAGAPGGAKEYYEEGYLVNGFALLAWPAEYGVSGVMTFIVAPDGVVYEKDLGPDSAKLADAIELFDPATGWHEVAVADQQPAGS